MNHYKINIPRSSHSITRLAFNSSLVAIASHVSIPGSNDNTNKNKNTKIINRTAKKWTKVNITPPSSMYHITLFKVPQHPLQCTTSPSSKYHTTIFKVPHHLLQSTTPPSSKYHITLFKVPHHPLRCTQPPSSKYHTGQK